MNPSILIGALALMSIGTVLAASVFHFGWFLRDPRNRGHALNVFVAGGTSASTKAGEAAPGDTTLKQRLDDSFASLHPADPRYKYV